MKIASAQIKSTVGEINQNLQTHYKMIDLASKDNVDLIIFPEMSVTGYCREEAKDFAMTEFDERLDLLKKKSIENNLTIVVGAPIKIDDNLYIGSFVICPDNSVKIYTKQFLHDGEELFYQSSFEHNPILKIGNEKISLAICADIENERHPQNASGINSSLYLPSIFYSKNGIDEGINKLKKYSETYSLHILMSNFSGEHWGIESGGKSCFINTKGEVKEKLKTNGEGLIVIEKLNGQWNSKIIEI